MDYKNYDFSGSSSSLQFSFVSSGTSGIFIQIIQYTPMPNHQLLPLWTGCTGPLDLVNLGFGVISEDGEIDDNIVINNGDTNEILATVACSTQEFFQSHPDYWVYFQGSSVARTALYGRKVSRHIDEISKFYHIYGYNTETTTFMPMSADVRFNGFLIKKRESNEDNEKD